MPFDWYDAEFDEGAYGWYARELAAGNLTRSTMVMTVRVSTTGPLFPFGSSGSCSHRLTTLCVLRLSLMSATIAPFFADPRGSIRSSRLETLTTGIVWRPMISPSAPAPFAGPYGGPTPFDVRRTFALAASAACASGSSDSALRFAPAPFAAGSSMCATCGRKHSSSSGSPRALRTAFLNSRLSVTGSGTLFHGTFSLAILRRSFETLAPFAKRVVCSMRNDERSFKPARTRGERKSAGRGLGGDERRV